MAAVLYTRHLWLPAFFVLSPSLLRENLSQITAMEVSEQGVVFFSVASVSPVLELH